MPYIKQEDRDNIFIKDSEGGYISHKDIETAGEMQYAIAVIIKSFIERKCLNYQNCNDVMGALVGAQQEFYRRVVAPYEEEKIKENGDVTPFSKDFFDKLIKDNGNAGETINTTRKEKY